jgi:hypothetical protein
MALALVALIDLHRYIDRSRYEVGGEVVLRLRRDRESVVEFCDGCGRVCDAACRRQAVLAEARDKAMRWGRL